MHSPSYITKDSKLIFDNCFCLEVMMFKKFEMCNGKPEMLYSWNKNAYKETKSEDLLMGK